MDLDISKPRSASPSGAHFFFNVQAAAWLIGLGTGLILCRPISKSNANTGGHEVLDEPGEEAALRFRSEKRL
jgi:hypothetical protein